MTGVMGAGVRNNRKEKSYSGQVNLHSMICIFCVELLKHLFDAE